MIFFNSFLYQKRSERAGLGYNRATQFSYVPTRR